MSEQCESTPLEQPMQESSMDGMAERIDEPGQARAIDDDEVAALAYRLWLERGCPEGSPQEDWFMAEREVRRSSATRFAAEERSMATA